MYSECKGIFFTSLVLLYQTCCLYFILFFFETFLSVGENDFDHDRLFLIANSVLFIRRCKVFFFIFYFSNDNDRNAVKKMYKKKKKRVIFTQQRFS